MGVVSKYFSDKTLVDSLRNYYDEKTRYKVNFQYWFHTATITKDGIVVTIENRKFLIDEFTGSVEREIV